MIIALHSVLHAGAEEEYDTRHQRIPDDLVITFARIGIREWAIWRSGRDLFHLVDCDDWLAANEALAIDPANAAWQADIGPLVEGFAQVAGPGPAGQVLPQVYSLRTQQATTSGETGTGDGSRG